MSLIDSEQHAHKSLMQREATRLVDLCLVSHDLHLLEVGGLQIFSTLQEKLTTIRIDSQYASAQAECKGAHL